MIGIFLWSVDPKNTGGLVHFKFDGIGWYDLDVAGDDRWGVIADRNSVPWMGSIQWYIRHIEIILDALLK